MHLIVNITNEALCPSQSALIKSNTPCNFAEGRARPSNCYAGHCVISPTGNYSITTQLNKTYQNSNTGVQIKPQHLLCACEKQNNTTWGLLDQQQANLTQWVNTASTMLPATIHVNTGTSPWKLTGLSHLKVEIVGLRYRNLSAALDEQHLSPKERARHSETTKQTLKYTQVTEQMAQP